MELVIVPVITPVVVSTVRPSGALMEFPSSSTQSKDPAVGSTNVRAGIIDNVVPSRADTSLYVSVGLGDTSKSIVWVSDPVTLVAVTV